MGRSRFYSFGVIHGLYCWRSGIKIRIESICHAQASSPVKEFLEDEEHARWGRWQLGSKLIHALSKSRQSRQGWERSIGRMGKCRSSEKRSLSLSLLLWHLVEIVPSRDLCLEQMTFSYTDLSFKKLFWWYGVTSVMQTLWTNDDNLKTQIRH